MDKFSKKSGFSLIEVLVAIFVLAVGILGIAGLQLFAKQNNFDAVQRTSAAALTTSIVERMRLNTEATGSYVSSAEPVDQTTAAPATCSSSANNCTPAEIAAHDLQQWYSEIIGVSEVNADGNNAGGLVAPSACITSLGTDEFRIAIAWRGRSALSSPTISDCGEDATSGGTNIYGANNEYRRIFVIDANIE